MSMTQLDQCSEQLPVDAITRLWSMPGTHGPAIGAHIVNVLLDRSPRQETKK